MTLRAIILVLVAAFAAGPARAADVVVRRGSEPSLQGEVYRINDAGVWLRSELGADHFVPWDRVRDVRIDQHDPRLDAYLELATTLWRARSRLERHDSTLAEPLFDRLWGRYRGQTHETALVVAEGLLRCRLHRADHAAALVPALEVIRMRRAGVTTASYVALRPVYDETYGLCTMMAPAWIPSRGLERLEDDLGGYRGGDDPVVAELARLYLHSIRTARGDDAGAIPGPGTPGPGVELLAAVLRAGSDDRSTRSGARDLLAHRMETMPEWARAWAHYHVGVSLLRESGVGQQQRGLVHLAHVAARDAHAHRYLAGLALDRMAAGLEALGDAPGAARVRTELNRRYAHHPVLRQAAGTLTTPRKDRS